MSILFHQSDSSICMLEIYQMIKITEYLPLMKLGSCLVIMFKKPSKCKFKTQKS